MDYLTMALDHADSSRIDECPLSHDDRPLWRYVTKIGKGNEKGGNVTFTCHFCEVSYKGSYSRVKAHLLKLKGSGIRLCPKVSVAQLNEMSKLENEASQRRERSQRKSTSRPLSQSPTQPLVMDALSSSLFKHQDYEPKKRKHVGDTALEKSFDLQAKEQLDVEIARMFYSGGVPFNLARNPHFIRAFTLAANSHLEGYIPPTYNALRTNLLETERTNLDNLFENTKHTWKSKDVTIVCDGWTDLEGKPLINFMAVNEGGTKFLRAVKNEGECKDKWVIFNKIKEVMMEVGVSNVIQVITENAPVCRAAGLLIEQAYPHVFWAPCIVHSLDLGLKSICAGKTIIEGNEIKYEECHWITEIIATASMIKNFIMNHALRVAILNEFPKLKLLAVAETRFASDIVMLKRFKLMKDQLKSMSMSNHWSCYCDDDVVKARIVKEKLLDDSWWDSIEYLLAFTEPIYDMIRACDTDNPCLHLVYEMWETMVLQVKTTIYKHEAKDDYEICSFWNVVNQVLKDTRNKTITPLHYLAHSLNPRCTTEDWLVQHPNLTRPDSDPEISKMRHLCVKRYFPNEDTRREVNMELANFFGYLEHYCEGDSMRDRSEMDPILWWLVHGASSPLVQTLAVRLLGQVSSASCCMKNWNTYGFMHSATRNQITSQCAQDLVYVHNNLRLLSRKSPEYWQGETKMWDVGGDAFESMYDDVGILEVSNLSLDEPDMESVLFLDEENEESRIYHNI